MKDLIQIKAHKLNESNRFKHLLIEISKNWILLQISGPVWAAIILLDPEHSNRTNI